MVFPPAHRPGCRGPVVTRRWLVGGACAAVVAIVVGTTLGRSLIDSSEPSVSSGSDRPSASAERGSERLVRFHDVRANFSIAYPAGWTRLKPADPEVELLVARDENTSMLVRNSPVGLKVTRTTLSLARDLTDSLVRVDGRVRLRGEPREILLGGLPGFRYVYEFSLSEALRAVHVHYFLFKAGRMITLVFQTAPPQELERVGPLFDRLVRTFEGSG